MPFPVGMLLLYLFLRRPLYIWFITYLTTLSLYTLIHILVSYFSHFHSLIPAWKLSYKTSKQNGALVEKAKGAWVPSSFLFFLYLVFNKKTSKIVIYLL